jgi:uncharacterized MAPEG superfamily protein
MMTTELWYLFLTSVLLTVLWIPYIIGSVQTAGPLQPEEYRVGRHVEFPHWVRRADRAHINLVEQFGAFAGLVVVAHLTGVHNSLAVWCVIVFFWARILHAIVYIAGVTQFSARTLIFTIGFLALIVYAVDIFMYAVPAAIPAA